MALRTPDLIRQLSTTTGTGTYTLGAALPGFRAASATLVNGDTFYYRAVMGTDWEIGLGTINASGNLVRTTILLSTNANAAVNWGAGNKVIFSVAPEALLDTFFRTAGGTLTGDLTLSGNARSLIFDSPAVTGRTLKVRVGSADRWTAIIGTGAESGANAGSNIFWQSYDDAGSFLATVLQMNRTGEVGVGGVSRANTALAVRTKNVTDADGIFVQNDSTDSDASVSIKIAGAAGAVRAAIRGQRVGTTSNGRMVLSAFLGGTNVDVMTINSDGTARNAAGSRHDAFESGTRLVFQQSTAPLGWTKDTTLNDRALRVVSGSVTNGGGAGFSSLFASRTPTGYVDYHVLTESEMPSHTHEWTSLPGAVVTTAAGSGNISSGMGGASQIPYTNFALNSKGGNAGHNHPLVLNAMDFSVAYTDTVVCQKD